MNARIGFVTLLSVAFGPFAAAGDKSDDGAGETAPDKSSLVGNEPLRIGPRGPFERAALRQDGMRRDKENGARADKGGE